jgi:hypothetical protein
METVQAFFTKILVGDPQMDFFLKCIWKYWWTNAGKILLKHLIFDSLMNLTKEIMGDK